MRAHVRSSRGLVPLRPAHRPLARPSTNQTADVPWEDEKFSYVAVSRKPAARVRARVIARPRKAGGHITLKLCRPDGLMDNQSFLRRDGAQFKRAWRTDWGSSL
jgi:ribosomal protein RSM22 (predicted rRNA methylase)